METKNTHWRNQVEVITASSPVLLTKALNEFYKNPQTGTKDGLNSWCKKCINKKNNENYHKRMNIKGNRQKERDKARQWRKNNREKARKNSKNFTDKRRLKIINHYSKGQNRCACCGENIIEFLSIDHINGNGNKHRKIIGRGGLPGWIIKNNFPKGFQVLCHNCNFAKGHYGQCPHIINNKKGDL